MNETKPDKRRRDPSTLSRQRRDQLRLVAEGKCQYCGRPNSSDKPYCLTCPTKQYSAQAAKKGKVAYAKREEMKRGTPAYQRLHALAIPRFRSMAALGKAAGLSAGFYIGLRTGAKPHFGTLSVLASALQMPVSDLYRALFEEEAK